jgi:predicted GIY-YIG superfamily endonuclease
MGKSKEPHRQEGADPAAGDGGTVYLLHLDPPLHHARHYVGWTSDLDQRLEEHRTGTSRARLMEVIKEAGGSFRLVRTWAGSRSLERAIKNRKNAPKLCPECTPEPMPLARGRSAAPPGAQPSLFDLESEPRSTPAARRRPASWSVPAAEAEAPQAVPEAEIVREHLERLRPRPVTREAYAELAPFIERLERSWQAQVAAAEPDAEMELEALPRIPNPRTSNLISDPREEPNGHLEKQPKRRD